MAEENMSSSWTYKRCPHCGELVWSVCYSTGEWQPASDLHICKQWAESENAQLRADRDRLAAELEAVQQALFGYGHGSLVDRVNTITAREVEYVERADRLAARVRELEAALTAFVEAEDINRQYDGTYDSPPGHVVAEMYERAAAMARAALADSSGPAADSGEEA